MLKKSTNNLLILGAGGHGKIVADCAKETGIYERIAFLDDSKKGQTVLGMPVLGTFSDAELYKNEFTHSFIALGNNQQRIDLIERMISFCYQVPVIIHPSAVISKYAEVSEGSLVLAGVIVNADAKIGRGCIINTSASIDHDCKLGAGVHISPGARLGGMVTIGDFTWVCIGASIANNINIGSGSVVAAGAAVVTDVDSNTMVAGVPAKMKKRVLSR